MLRLKHIVLLLFVLPFYYTLAQTEQQTAESEKLIRLEIDTKAESQPFKIIPFDKKGLLVFYESVASTEDKDHVIWVFRLYDINLRQLWIQELPILKNISFQKSDMDDQSLYLFFYEEENNTNGNNFQIVKVPGKEGVIRAKTGRIPEKSRLTHFEMSKQYAIYNIETKDNNSIIYKYDLTSGTIDSLMINDKGMSYLFDMKVDSVNQTIKVYFKTFIEKTEETLYLRTYDFSWNTLKTVEIPNDENVYLVNSGQIFPLDADKILIMGTYQDNPKGKYNLDAEDITMESTGFYVTKVSGDTCNFIRYHNFSIFNSFYRNLSVNDISRIRKSGTKSEQIAVDYNLLIHKVIPVNDTYVFVAEAYYPEYHTVTRMMYDWYGRPMPSYYNVFDGFRYTSAFIAAFDEDGNLRWDNGLELWDILSNTLENRVNVIFEGDESILAYALNGEVTYKVIKGKEDINNLDHIKVESKYTKDKLIEETGSNMVYWYGNYFLTYGYQTIKNNTLPDKAKRTVFYVNKIAFD
jgi:hypothetical protein